MCRSLIDSGKPLGVAMDGGAAIFGVLLLAAVSSAIYFTPAIVAVKRRTRVTMGVFLLNFFLGWTLLGWVVSLVWAVSAPVETPELSPPPVRPTIEPGVIAVRSASASPPPIAPAADTKVCPMCAETVLKAARICRFCRYDFPTEREPESPRAAPPSPDPDPEAVRRILEIADELTSLDDEALFTLTPGAMGDLEEALIGMGVELFINRDEKKYILHRTHGTSYVHSDTALGRWLRRSVEAHA